jgi:hypothetical protein
MKRYGMAAVGAIWLFVLGGCMSQTDVAVSAMPRANDLRAEASAMRVTVELKEIVTP